MSAVTAIMLVGFAPLAPDRAEFGGPAKDGTAASGRRHPAVLARIEVPDAGSLCEFIE